MLHIVAQSLKPVKLFSQQLPTSLLFRDLQSVAQQCWIHLQSSSNNIKATHAHYLHMVYSLMGCILPTMHCRSQHCWELLHPFAHHCQKAGSNSQHCGWNNVGSCCVRLRIALPALLIDVRHSITIFFKSNAPALLPWYSIAYSPETCSSLIILHQNSIKFYTCSNPC